MRRILLNIVMLAAAVASAMSCASAQTRCVEYGVKVINTYPHDKTSYTQGLFFWKGTLYESTGEWGSSTLRTVDLKTGKALIDKPFNKKYFGEGSCVAGGRLYMLTWTNNVAFVYDPVTLEYQKTYSYPREGWGITSLPSKGSKGEIMVASDGSGTLFFLDETFKAVRTLKVTLEGKAVRYLNELEWIDGRIWANVYTTDMIFIINPDSGAVEGRIDCSNLIPRARRTPDMDVLNGIAVNEKGQIFLTGKNWPSLFEVQLIKK